MANPTTNYGFVLPTSTDLVTDLPADFDVALQGVDTRLKALQPGTTLGDIAYSSATANTNTRLGIGSTGQVLTVASGVPSWSTPAAGGGGMTLIAETVANADSAIDYTSISGSYTDLRLEWYGVYHSTSGSNFGIRLNNDSASNYNESYTYLEGTSPVGVSIFGLNQTSAGQVPFGNGSTDTTPNRTVMGVANIYNYASATKFKKYDITNFYYVPSRYNSFTVSGYYASQTAVTQVNIFRAAGSATLSNLTNTTIRLYGVK